MNGRRVVTVEAGGSGVVVSDGPPQVFGRPDSPEGVEIGVFWVSADSPPDLQTNEDPAHPAWNMSPVPGHGCRWTRLTFHPGARARGMHRTQTLDFVQVISGEIHLVLSGGEERKLGPGDAVVQRGATHAWENRSDQPCVLSAVMLNAR
jgi:quercetin dioxygenase-like cupin family protein